MSIWLYNVLVFSQNDIFCIFCMVFDAWKVEIIKTIGIIAIIATIGIIATIATIETIATIVAIIIT